MVIGIGSLESTQTIRVAIGGKLENYAQVKAMTLDIAGEYVNYGNSSASVASIGGALRNEGQLNFANDLKVAPNGLLINDYGDLTVGAFLVKSKKITGVARISGDASLEQPVVLQNKGEEIVCLAIAGSPAMGKK